VEGWLLRTALAAGLAGACGGRSTLDGPLPRAENTPTGGTGTIGGSHTRLNSNVSGSQPSGGAQSSGGTPGAGGSPASTGTSELGGQVGSGGTTNPSSQVGLSIANGLDHTCVVMPSGTIRCWGANSSGQLGDATTAAALAPVTVRDITSATQVTAGSRYSCALLKEGTVRCWGGNFWHQLGNSSTKDSTLAVLVPGVSNASAIASGAMHNCVIASGQVYCWGHTSDANANPKPGEGSATALPVGGVTSAVAVACGADHTCALQADGLVQCWTYYPSNQLGSGVPNYTPMVIGNLSGAVAIAAGSLHTCAALSDGSVRCWGLNMNGTLGIGDGTFSSETALQVIGLSQVVGITSGSGHNCALLKDSTVRCWGDNRYGELGNGTTGSSSFSPVQVFELTNVTALSRASLHTCSGFDDGAIRCWGHNSSGQLGDGTQNDSSTPVAVLGL
jgi:alpha-tubulin suppressor-like RCC1 family protein